MRRLVLAGLVALIAAYLSMYVTNQMSFGAPQSPGGPNFSVEAFIWRFNEDYPGSRADTETPISTVYINTHDGTNWMSKWDKNPNAISGPDSLRTMVQKYDALGIRTIAWFVPKGNDYQAQIQMAQTVLDTGVDALYSDVEPWTGFCDADCPALAENVWKPLRASRPEAKLGVIYDPRPGQIGPSGLASWLSVADVALPMCYWNDFSRAPWNDPDGCIRQASADLATIAPGDAAIEYVPIVPGVAAQQEVKTAISTIVSLGGNRMSIWRRGVVTVDVWSAIDESRPAPAPAPAQDPVEQVRERLTLPRDRLQAKSPHPFTVPFALIQILDRYLALMS